MSDDVNCRWGCRAIRLVLHPHGIRALKHFILFVSVWVVEKTPWKVLCFVEVPHMRNHCFFFRVGNSCINSHAGGGAQFHFDII